MTIDRDRYPHKCSLCERPAYLGATAHECSNPACRMWDGEVHIAPSSKANVKDAWHPAVTGPAYTALTGGLIQ